MYNNAKYTNNEMSTGYVRVIHTVPDAPNVDVYADDKLIIRNLAYGNYTDYLSIPEGTYKISLYVAGTRNSPVLANMLTVNKNSILTVAAVGKLSDIGLLAITDSNERRKPGKALIRFLHLSPNAPAVDITLPDGTVVFSNVAFKHITPYIDVPPMNYTLQVRVAGTSNVVLTVPDVNLFADEYYTVYAIGLVGEKPELEALLLMDGKNK
ncbi:DUF4397 domain-containing protein [Anaerocolumna sp. AGMB13020]|uniref:DUF4397 domain-containing protein n=1 Tax=Anaerocolumna sp. AGMB13020 TaxID=3081750 RepID=UPI002955BAF7|nr:DUF4397 domain-containing protein [Anaerocolumna sp. AGMB13020]WOO35864.1 DUF4397 domain-containing protein [Anaerocolumna sp. AGMB13020]